MEIDKENTLKIEYCNDNFIDDLMHNFTDYHLNSYDNKIYYGDPTEKFIDHSGIEKYDSLKIDHLRCNYCYEKFKSHNELIRHLGYNNVDIRNRKNNLLITNFYQPKKLKNKFSFSPEINFIEEIAKDSEEDYKNNLEDGFLGDVEDNKEVDSNKEIKYTKDLDNSFLEHFKNISVTNNYSKCKNNKFVNRSKNKNKYLCPKCSLSVNSKLIKKTKLVKHKKTKLNISIDNLTKYFEKSKI